MNTDNEIKEMVKQKYSEIALQDKSDNAVIYSIAVYAQKPNQEAKNCCGPDCCN